MSRNLSDEAFVEAIRTICSRINTPSAGLLCESLFERRAVDIKFEPSSYSERVDLAEAYMLSKILSKWKGWMGVASPEAAAYDEWYIVENECRKTNKRLNDLIDNAGYPGTYLISVISTAQRIISEILGDFEIRKVLRSCRWGPGATCDLRRGTYRDQKMTQSMSTTQEALPYMKAIIESDPNWLEAITGFYPDGPVSLLPTFWKVTPYAKLTTVPKKWNIDRTIDMQPTANGYLQQGTGRYFRSRLLQRVGIDLTSQEENQRAAFEAVFDDLATLDLKGASDSVAHSLCTLLFPWQWTNWLNKLRTSYTIGPKGPVRLEKFSSMGNAFTFELETIVFYAITRAVCEVDGSRWDRVRVYGDDIVLPQGNYDNVVLALNYLGFQINTEKSFSSGEFFESCGRHYFRGDDVTPIYQKSLVNSPEEAIRFYNRLVRWSDRTYADPFRFEEALTLMIDAFMQMKPKLSFDRLPKIPLGNVSDDGFILPDDFFAFDSNGGFYTYVYRKAKDRAKGRRNECCYLQLKLSANIQNSDPKGHVYEDSGRGRYLLSRAYFYRR
jgi:hypothetical protein